MGHQGSPIDIKASRADFYGAAATLLVLSLALKVLGIGQQALLAYLFGASNELDAFLVAVSLPMMAINILSSGSLSLAFVPLFSEYYTRGQHDEAWAAASIVGNVSLIVAVVLLAVGAAGAPAIARWLGPGFDVETSRLTAQLLILLLPTVALATLSAIVKSVLYFFRRFGIANFAYVLGTSIVLVMVVTLHRWLGVRAVAFGLVVSGIVALGFQLVVLRSVGPRYYPSLRVRQVGVKETSVLLLGMTLSIVALQLNLIIDRTFASTLGEGSVSILEYAADFDKLIVQTFAISAAIAIYPALSDLYSWAREQEFADRLASTITSAALAALPLAGFALVLRREIIGTVLERGQFGAAETEAVSRVLVQLIPALVAWSLLYTAVYALFARRKAALPTLVMVGMLGTNTVLDAWLAPSAGVPGIACATSIAAWIGSAVLWVLLLRQVPALDLRRLCREMIKIAIAAGAATVASWLVAGWMHGLLPGGVFTSRVAILVASAAAGGCVYVAAVWLMAIEEAREMARWAGEWIGGPLKLRRMVDQR